MYSSNPPTKQQRQAYHYSATNQQYGGQMGAAPMGQMGAPIAPPNGGMSHNMQMGAHQQQSSSYLSGQAPQQQQMQRMMSQAPQMQPQAKRSWDYYQQTGNQMNYQMQPQNPVPPPLPKNNSRRKRSHNKAQLDEPVPIQHYQPPPPYGYQQNNSMMQPQHPHQYPQMQMSTHQHHQMSAHHPQQQQQIGMGSQQQQMQQMSVQQQQQQQYMMQNNSNRSEIVRRELRHVLQVKQQHQQREFEQQHNQQRMQSGMNMQMQQQAPQLTHQDPPVNQMPGAQQQMMMQQNANMMQQKQAASMQQTERANFNIPHAQMNQNTPISSVASSSSASSSLDFGSDWPFFDYRDPELPISYDKLEQNLESLQVHDFQLVGRCGFDMDNESTRSLVMQLLLLK